MRSFLAGLRRLVIPWGTSGDQPRIVIATDDPLASTFSDAAISFYYGLGAGFVASVDRDGNGAGIWRLSAAPAGAPFSDRNEYLHAEYNPADPILDSVEMTTGYRLGIGRQPGYFRGWWDNEGNPTGVGVAEIGGEEIRLLGPTEIVGDLAVTGTLTAPGLSTRPAVRGVSAVALPVGSAPAAYNNLPTPSGVSTEFQRQMVKQGAAGASKLLVRMSLGAFTNTAGSTLNAGVRVRNETTGVVSVVQIINEVYTAVGHKTPSGSVLIDGDAGVTYTLTPVWRNGSGAMSCNSADFFSYTIEEVDSVD